MLAGELLPSQGFLVDRTLRPKLVLDLELAQDGAVDRQHLLSRQAEMVSLATLASGEKRTSRTEPVTESHHQLSVADKE